MVYVVENGTPTLIEELHSAASGEIETIGEAYVVTDGTPALVYSSGFAVTIQGAPGETVTYTGKDSGSVTLDENGDAELVLRPGVYTFTGSISGTRADVRISRGVPVTMWPDNVRILYWYGRFGLLDDGVTKQSVDARISSSEISGASLTQMTNALRLYAYARYNNTYNSSGLVCVHFSPVSFTGYTKLVYRVSGRSASDYGTKHSQLGQKSSVGTGEAPNSFTANGTHTYDINPALPYVCASAYDHSNGVTSTSNVRFDVNAVYLM